MSRGPNLPIAAASLGLSVLLWMVVYTNSPTANQPVSFTAPLVAQGVEERRFAVTKIDPNVRFSAIGDINRLTAVRRDGVTATVDLSNATPGTATYPVRLSPPWLTDIVVNRPLTVRVTIEPIARKTLPVTLDTVGRLRDDNLALSQSPLEPSEIVLTGPESAVRRTTKALVTLDLGEVDPNAPREATLPVRLADADGNLVSGARVVAEPPTVLATPVLSLAPAEKTVLVSPIFEGTPAAGFAPSGYRLDPEQITLRGDASLLAQTSKVFTEPISVRGVRSDLSVRVRLRIPPGTRLVEGRETVRVRYLVRPTG